MTALPFWTYLDEFTEHKQEILQIFESALLGGKLILGRRVLAFEQEFSSYCQRKYALGVGNGTDAIFLALKGLGIGPGDEVITVPNSAIPTASAIVATGATPVFVDIRWDSMNMDPEKLEAAITKHTKCIIPVHLYGNPAQMDKINKIAKTYKVFVLEDCAQATGALFKGSKIGSLSDIASFSFYPTKIIGAYGDGGAIVMNKQTLYKKTKMLRMYGTNGTYYSYFSGYNSRLDEIQAALLSWKLERIELYIKKREAIAKRYQEKLQMTNLILPTAERKSRHVWHLYVVRHPRADRIIEQANKRGVNLASHYRHPLHTQKAYRYLGYTKGAFPIAEKSCRQVISLPIYPELSEKDQDKIIDTIIKILNTL